MTSSETTFVQVSLESTELDCEQVQIAKLTGREELSMPFAFEIEVVALEAEGHRLDVERAVGAAATLVFEEAGVPLRRVHGMVSEVHDLLDSNVGFTRYRLTIVPRLHKLALVETQEVFLGKSVPAIIEQKLLRAGLGERDFVFRLSAAYEPRDFVLQYRETDLAFVSRLAEHLGIAFHFEHASGRDVVVFSDGNHGFAAAAEKLHYHARGEKRFLFELESRSGIFAGKHVVMDYDDQHPKLHLDVEHVVEPRFPGVVVEYGAAHLSPKEGKALAQVRAEERVGAHRYYVGRSGHGLLETGTTIAVEGHARLEGARFLVTAIEHHVVQTTMTEGPASQAERYSNTFRAAPADRPYRPARRTPKPRIDGFVHAVTEAAPVGGSGRIAQLDEQGRYTVRFFFDMAEAPGRRTSSAPVRMMQPHAGPSYGMHFPLKPDVEVLVAFIDGDPDRPVIAGAVPNPLTQSPVTQKNPQMNRIETESGVYIRMKDA